MPSQQQEHIDSKASQQEAKEFELGVTSFLPDPVRYKNFLVWPNTVLNEMDYIDCAQTAKGYCMSGKSLEECIDITAAEGTGLGTLITYPNNDTICMSIRTSVYPNVNPVNNLRIQAIYPQLRHTTVHTFVDTNKFPDPDYYANAMYAYDIVEMINVETGYTLSPGSATETKRQYDLWFNDGPGLRLQLANFDNPEFVPYDKISHGEPIALYVPGTSMELIGTANNTIVAANGVNRVVPFELVAINRKNKDYISYDDTFALKYGESFVVLDKEMKFLYFLNVSLDVLLSSTESGFTSSSSFFFQFKFRPQVKVYYCEGNVCFQTELNKTDMDGVKATYKGKQVSRQTDCWGKCVLTEDLLLWMYRDYVPHGHTKKVPGAPVPTEGPSNIRLRASDQDIVNVGKDAVRVRSAASYNPGRYRTVLLVVGGIIVAALLGAFIYSKVTKQSVKVHSRQRL